MPYWTFVKGHIPLVTGRRGYWNANSIVEKFFSFSPQNAALRVGVSAR
jgi:hypothetical protein